MAEKTSAKAAGNPPISRHPLFPVIVALWFGALFGLVSLAIKPELIEQIVVASGIDSLIPMATPPLGTTMRILLALAMTGTGAVTGGLIALKIARPEPQPQKSGRRPRPRKKDLALAAPLEETVRPAAPPQAAAILNVSEFDLDGCEGYAAQSACGPVAARGSQEREPLPAGNHLFDTYSREIVARPAADIAAPEGVCEPAEAIPAPPVRALPRAAERIASAELDTLSQMELLERLALAMAQCRKAVVPTAAAARLETLDVCAITQDLRETAGDPDPVPDAAPEVEGESSLLSAPELPEIEAPHHEIAPAPASWEEEPEAQIPAPEPWPEHRRMPPALRPVGYDSPDEEDALPGYVPPRRIALSENDRTAPAFAPPEPAAFDCDEEAEDDVLEEGYSSLLDLSRSSAARQRFSGAGPEMADHTLAGNDGPTAEPDPADGHRPFDHRGWSDPDDTEKALRAALATLQRMSGAA